MGLTRSSSGLILRDEFGSDTLATYEHLGNDDWDWDTDHVVYNGVDTDGFIARHDLTAAKCMTARVRQDGVLTGWSKPVMVGWNGSLQYGWAPESYWAETDNGSATATNVIRCLPWDISSLGGLTTASRSHSTWYLWRIYLNSDTVYVNEGATALAALGSKGDSSYASGGFGVGGSHPFSCDWLEARTAHTITCSGMTDGHYLRVTDGTTAAEAAASGGTATVDAGLVTFPLTSAAIFTAASGGGTKLAEITSGTLADMGGGDAFAYSADAAGGNPYYAYAQQ